MPARKNWTRIKRNTWRWVSLFIKFKVQPFLVAKNAEAKKSVKMINGVRFIDFLGIVFFAH